MKFLNFEKCFCLIFIISMNMTVDSVCIQSLSNTKIIHTGYDIINIFSNIESDIISVGSIVTLPK